jgi:hypothetical protein
MIAASTIELASAKLRVMLIRALVVVLAFGEVERKARAFRAHVACETALVGSPLGRRTTR